MANKKANVHGLGVSAESNWPARGTAGREEGRLIWGPGITGGEGEKSNQPSKRDTVTCKDRPKGGEQGTLRNGPLQGLQEPNEKKLMERPGVQSGCLRPRERFNASKKKKGAEMEKARRSWPYGDSAFHRMKRGTRARKRVKLVTSVASRFGRVRGEEGRQR